MGRTENSRLAAALQRPDVETLGFGDPSIGAPTPVPLGSAEGRTVLDRYRQVVSGAHLSGARVITNEWGAVLDGQFRVRLEDLEGARRPIAGRGRHAHGAPRVRLPAVQGRRGPAPAEPGLARVVRVLRPDAGVLGRLEPALAADAVSPRFERLLGRAGAALRKGRPEST